MYFSDRDVFVALFEMTAKQASEVVTEMKKRQSAKQSRYERWSGNRVYDHRKYLKTLNVAEVAISELQTAIKELKNA